MKIGQELYDMHYGGNFALVMAHNRIQNLGDGLHLVQLQSKKYVMRDWVEWGLEESNAFTGSFAGYLQSTMRSACGTQYTNKLLIVLGEALPYHDYNELHWFVAGYSYDARRAGVCQIAEAK